MAASSSEGAKMLTLVSCENDTFEVDYAVAVQSKTIKNIIDDGCDEGKIPLPNVNSKTLTKVIVYCKKHANDGENDDDHDREREGEIKKFDEEFANELEGDQNLLFDSILAANYLDIKGLLDLLCKKVADMMKGKSPEEIRKIFHIKNDFTPEEEAEVRRENAWAFE